MDIRILFLIIETNELSIEGSKEIAKLIRGNKHITDLDLGSNSFGSEGCKEFALGLKENNVLEKINLRNSTYIF